MAPIIISLLLISSAGGLLRYSTYKHMECASLMLLHLTGAFNETDFVILRSAHLNESKVDFDSILKVNICAYSRVSRGQIRFCHVVLRRVCGFRKLKTLVSSKIRMTCKEAGKFPLKNRRAFLECSLTHPNGLTATVRSCGDLYYSPTEKTCVQYIDEVHNGLVKNERIRRNVDGDSFNPTAFVESAVQADCGSTNLTGVFCVNRTHVALCIATYSNNGTYSPKTLAYPCSEETVCLPGEGCKNDVSLLSRARPFACSDEGRFPDQHNCSIYHDCTVSTTGFQMNTTECTGGQIYSINSSACVNASEVESCFPENYCRSDLEVGVLIDNSSIFYVCHTDSRFPGDLSPSLYTCPAQQVFNPAVLACVSTLSNLPWGALPSPIIFK